jgi:hypothetical protein
LAEVVDFSSVEVSGVERDSLSCATEVVLLSLGDWHPESEDIKNYNKNKVNSFFFIINSPKIYLKFTRLNTIIKYMDCKYRENFKFKFNPSIQVSV